MTCTPRYITGKADAATVRLGRPAHGRELRVIPGIPSEETPETWITSTPFFDPMGDGFWKAMYKRLDHTDHFYATSNYASVVPYISENGARSAAEHVGYGWEWRYNGYRSTTRTGTDYQPPVRFTTEITNGITEGHTQTWARPNLNNPLTWLMLHYGRPVIPRGSEVYKDSYTGIGGSQGINREHHYDLNQSQTWLELRQTVRESMWVSQLKSAAEQICGYPDAVPGDFLIGMLPADHWSGPKGINKIGIRLGLSDDGYYGYDDISHELYSLDASWPQYAGDSQSIGRWPKIWPWNPTQKYNTSQGSRPVVPYWLDKRIYTGGFNNVSKLSGGRVKFKYKVFLGGEEITTQSLDEQPWIVNLWNGERSELDVTIPPGWVYEQTDIAVELYFWEDLERSGYSGFQYSSICFGQNGFGDFVWPGIDIVYDLTREITEPNNVTISEDGFNWTEGRILPLSGRLALREQEAWQGRTEGTYTIATSDYSADMVTGFFPAGSNHLAVQLPITENRTNTLQHNVQCSHLPTAIDSYVDPFGHWSENNQVFVERLRPSYDLAENPTGALTDGSETLQTADNFIPLWPGVEPRTLIVTPDE